VSVQNLNWKGMTNLSKTIISRRRGSTLKPFDQASSEHFDIDGPGGETVTEAHKLGCEKLLLSCTPTKPGISVLERRIGDYGLSKK
jgi:hypothetical protein